MARSLMPCGTHAAAMRHYRDGEKPCEPCRAALAQYGRPYNRARMRTRIALAQQFRERFVELLDRERALLGLAPTGESTRTPDMSRDEYLRLYSRARSRAYVRLTKAMPSEYKARLQTELQRAHQEKFVTTRAGR